MRKRRGMLVFYVATGVALALVVGGWFTWTPLRVWYQKRQVPKAPSYLLSPDCELWDREQLQAKANKGDLEAHVKLAELKIRSCGGDEVGTRLRHVLAEDPAHVRANLHFGVWLLETGGSEEADTYLGAAATHAPRLSNESIHACQMLNWIAKAQKDKSR